MLVLMAARTCPKCGNALPEHARFCGQCGTVVPDLTQTLIDSTPAGALAGQQQPSPATPRLDQTMAEPQPDTPVVPAPPTPVVTPLGETVSAPSRAPSVGRVPVQRTMLGFASPVAEPPRPAQPAPQLKGTIVGMPASEAWASAKPTPTPAPIPAAGPTAPAAPPKTAMGTMLGVPIPGSAQPGPGAPPPPAKPNRTMLGVAIPGIAPTHAGVERAAPPPPVLRQAIEIAPMPPPLVDDEPLPPPPIVPRRRGAPLAIVASVVAVLALAAGITLAVIWKKKPLEAQPRVDAQGKEELHLRCEGCPDGTVVGLDGAQAPFKGGEADLPLVNPLKVGDNSLKLHLDRPNLGRDETVTLVVPVLYRVRADLSEIGAAHPAINVRVEALPGSDVQVDGKPVALDANGNGAYALDVAGDTEGPADEKRTIDRTVPYVVTPKGGQAQRGTVTARVDVVPLHLDAPGSRPVIEASTFHLAGKTLRGASLTANGRPVSLDADGSFAEPFDAPALGDLPVELRASAPSMAPRTAHLVVKRVEHLAEEAKAREQTKPLGYDAIAADIASASGRDTIVEGEIVEARTTQQQTLALIDDIRGCEHAPCLVRVVYGGETKLKHGDFARAYGRVTRAVAAASGTVPEVEADFVLLGHAPR